MSLELPTPGAATNVAVSPSADGTRTRILDVAEAAFAENGIDATSLRSITRIAGVNVAAVHYHFGSKDGLLDAVFARRAGDVTEARLAALAAIKVDNAESRDVAAILRAYIEPAVQRVAELGRRGLDIARLFARLQTERSERLEVLRNEHLAEVHQTFIRALCEALPHLTEREVAERFHMALGCMNHAFASDASTHRADRSDADWIGSLVGFASAGIAAGADEQGCAA